MGPSTILHKSSPGRAPWVTSCLLTIWLSTDALALGSFDGELGLAWWANDVALDTTDNTLSAGALSGHLEGWWDQKWGAKGALYRSDLEDAGLESTRHLVIDVKRRLVSPTDNTFLALGVGFEDIDLAGGGSASGFRLVGEGRVGLLGFLALYGQLGWAPDLGDAPGRRDLAGTELEFGLVIDPLPFVSLRLGYRRFNIDFEYTADGRSAESESDGFLLGAGLHW